MFKTVSNSKLFKKDGHDYIARIVFVMIGLDCYFWHVSVFLVTIHR